jgi:hypothetical protein
MTFEKYYSQVYEVNWREAQNYHEFDEYGAKG